MPDIFNSRAGYVAIVDDPKGTIIPGKIAIADFNPQAALISGINYHQKTNQQFQQALDQSVYIYVFGDLMGDVEIEGVAFPALCEGTGGIIEVLDFYKKSRASVIATPIIVQMGDESIQGFLTALSIKNTTLADDPVSFMAHYKFLINTLPS